MAILKYSDFLGKTVSSSANYTTMLVNDKRIINGWAFFDWANSSFALVIAVAIFPIYFNSVVDDEGFRFLGIELTNTVLFSYSLTVAYFIIAFSLPLLGGIADYSGRKLYFMRLFTILGGLACIILFFFTGMASLFLGVIAFILSVIGFAGGQVFNNAYLPLIASEDRYDMVSARGFAYGYVGSVLLLIMNLVLIQKYEFFGLADAGVATRISFIMVGVWWIGFAQITFNRLPKEIRRKNIKGILVKGYQEINLVRKQILFQPTIKRFLFAFFFYSAGVNTVIYLASTFATDELKFASSELILLILILQLVAIGGAYFFAYVSKKKGNKISLVAMLSIWTLICISAYFIYDKMGFYLLAIFVGLVMGGIQSISRSTYSKLIPKQTKDTASYFSFYDVLEKLAIVMGTFSFGIIDHVSGAMRNSILVLGVYFIVGLILILTLKIKDYSGTYS